MASHILGISALYHDAAAVLLRDGAIVAAGQEERFSRIKHDASFPERAAAWCLGEAGIRADQLDWLVFYEKPLRKFERIFANSVATFPRSWRAFPRAMQGWLGDKLWARARLAQTFGVRPDRILFCEHHLSHAASAFLCSPFDDAAVLTVDGVGEAASTSLWRGRANTLEPVSEIRFPHSLGMFYSAMTAHLGFAVNEGEYKVMGMAAYGAPRFRAEVDRLLRLDANGGFSIDLDYFTYHWHATESGSPRLGALLGPPRFPGTPFVPGEPESQHHADVAASVQAALEDAMLHVARHAHRTVGGDALCLAGGVALNSVANHRLATEGPFADLWIQPAAGDAGGALGAALWAWHCVLGNPRGARMTRSDLGRRWEPAQVRAVLDDLAVPYEAVADPAGSAALELAEGKVIGWFEGREEWGPRALGHRSILADPRSAAMRDTVNARVKFREPFRPFAPAVLEAEADAWFQIHPAERGAARWMLSTPPVRPERRAAIPAVTHVDGSARVQLVGAEDNPVFHRLIQRFFEATGVPLVLDTSFNLKGEPMVASPIDAVATFLRCELDALYIEGFRVTRGGYR